MGLMGLESEVSSLVDLAFRQLNDLDYDAALKTGKQLKKHRHSSWFEIAALAYQGRGQPKKAIKVLTEGTRKAPQVWLLWQLLGNLLSDSGELQDALSAYEQAKHCPDAEFPAIRLNQAIAMQRGGMHKEALDALGEETPTALHASVRVALLVQTKQATAAWGLAKQLLDRFGEKDDGYAYLLGEVSRACWLSTRDEQDSVRLAERSIGLKKDVDVALWTLRDARNEVSAEAKHFWVTVEGVWHQPLDGVEGQPGFLASYSVVADSEVEALSYIQRFEPEEVRNSLKIESVKVVGRAADSPKGVYEARPGYIFFGI